jgi:tRNA(fMet)-specific endonuclease VapC
MNYTIDTNIITALIKDNQKIKRKLQDIVLHGGEVFITGISYYEIKRGLLAINATRQLKIFEGICKNLEVILLDDQIIFDKASEIYADLKQRGQLIPDADILIAATTLTRNLVLVSDNVDHFQRIKNITLENWLTEKPATKLLNWFKKRKN